MRSSTLIPNIFTIAPCGIINAANAQNFEAQLVTTIESYPETNLLVDMEQVEFLDSAGLMVLVRTLRLAKTHDNLLLLCSVSPSIMILFELTQIDQAISIFADRESAYASV